MSETKPGAVVGTGATADVLAFGVDVLKLYHAGVSRDAADHEGAILDALEAAGIAAPRSRGVIAHDGRWGLVMTRAGGRPFAEAMLAEPAVVPAYVDALVALQLSLHAVSVPGLRSYAARLGEHIGWAGRLPPAQREHLLERLARMPVADRLCHGDFHPFNVLGVPGDAVIIDWVDATAGPPLADLARTYVLLHQVAPAIATAHVERYLATSGADRAEMEAWLPLVAAGRLAENAGPDEIAGLLALAAAG